jgi:ubiquinone/menaquinone biosynthesis C-methylase UbiE
MPDSPNQIDTTAARAYDDYMVPSMFGPWMEDVIALAHLQPAERVLDVACGTGTAAFIAAAGVTSRGLVAGLDVDPGMIEVARTKSQSPDGARVAWHCEDALKMSFQDGSFDVVLCLQGLQFFPDRLAGLREMRRVLTAAGRLVASVWRSIEHCKGHHALAKVLERYGLDAQAARRPFSLGDAEELIGLGQKAGFRNVSVQAMTKIMRFSSPQDFVQKLAAGAPSTRHALAKVPDDRRRELIEAVGAELQPYIDAEGVGIPYASHLLLAQS